jgi:hypothetical protein
MGHHPSTQTVQAVIHTNSNAGGTSFQIVFWIIAAGVAVAIGYVIYKAVKKKK